MQFQSVEACALGAPRRLRKQVRQRLRQIADMRQVHIRHPLTIALHKRFIFARR